MKTAWEKNTMEDIIAVIIKESIERSRKKLDDDDYGDYWDRLD
jgi:hypothetical protein